MLHMDVTATYDHRLKRIGHPVRSAIHKLEIGGLVVGWVTTSEYPLLYVFFCFLFLYIYSNMKRWREWPHHRLWNRGRVGIHYICGNARTSYHRISSVLDFEHQYIDMAVMCFNINIYVLCNIFQQKLLLVLRILLFIIILYGVIIMYDKRWMRYLLLHIKNNRVKERYTSGPIYLVFPYQQRETAAKYWLIII